MVVHFLLWGGGGQEWTHIGHRCLVNRQSKAGSSAPYMGWTPTKACHQRGGHRSTLTRLHLARAWSFLYLVLSTTVTTKEANKKSGQATGEHFPPPVFRPRVPRHVCCSLLRTSSKDERRMLAVSDVSMPHGCVCVVCMRVCVWL